MDLEIFAQVKCGNNQKKLFNVLGEMLQTKTKEILPDNDSNEDLANEFNPFFFEKSESIRNNLKDKNTEFVSLYKPSPQSRMDSFKEVSKDKLQSIISSLSSASCSIDPLPTPIVKQCLD